MGREKEEQFERERERQSKREPEKEIVDANVFLVFFIVARTGNVEILCT